MKNVVEKLELAQSQCAEFFADIIVDSYRNSIILNVETQYFEEIGRTLLSSGFYCVHITEFEHSVTACFILLNQ